MALRGGIFTGAPVRGLRPIRGFLLHAECPEPGEGKALTLPETVYGHPDDGIDRFARVDFRDVSVEGYRLDQLRFVHVL